MSKVPLLVIGGGEHAALLAETLKNQGEKIIAVFSKNSIKMNKIFEGIDHYTNDEDIRNFLGQKIQIVNGIGYHKNVQKRDMVFSALKKLGFNFKTIIADSALVSSSASIDQGVQILDGAIIQTGAILKENSIVNTGSIVEHNCIISRSACISPGAVICGSCNIGSSAIIGPGACIGNNVTIGEKSILGAGVSVVKNVPPSTKVLPSKTTWNKINE